MKLVLRWAIMAVALGITTWIMPGIRIEGTSGWIAVALMAVILGLLNATLRPLLNFLACGFVILTLGIGALFINGFVMWLSSWIAVNWFGIGFVIDGYWPAFWGGIICGVISWLLSAFLVDHE